MYRFARMGFMPMYTSPDQELSFIHVRDLARALVAATAPRCAGHTYFAAHPQSATAREMMTTIFRAVREATARPARAPRFLPIPRPLAVSALWVLGTAARLVGRSTILSADKGHEFLAEAWTCSPAALQRDTGWGAVTDLETGVRRTAEWYAHHGWL
jgi:nucleoside-diphosphate-sugar epimerase